jgi:hypothetical protein
LTKTDHALRALLVASAVACSSERYSPRESSVTDSAGIRIVESRSPQWNRTEVTWTLEQDPTIDIGGESPDGQYFLDGVTSAHLLGNGTVVVGNAGTSQLLWFDSTGSFLRSTGGPGQGPGEFGRIVDIFRCTGDTLAVFEGRRLSFIGSDGEFLRTAAVAGRILQASGTIGGISEDCTTVLAIEGEYRYPAPGEGVHQLPHVLAWASLASGNRDTLLVFPGPDLYPTTIRGQQASARLPFGKVPVWASDGTLAAYGSAGDFELQLFNQSAELESIIRWQAQSTSVEGPPFERFRSEQDAYIQANPENAQDILRAEKFPVPDRMPAYDGVLFDSEGNFWVRQYLHYSLYQTAPQSDRWWIIDRNGAWLGTLETPVAFQVLSVAHGFVVGVARDQNDVESVKLYRIM